ncbi:GNAT family N-acetyltransferase [Micromonospora endophytica]|uniref:GNAT family N-acetyltransferase n=1 Tax=Micromonospora endophytica TaxID=515350 RepID=UPI0015E88011|nr:GNAT family N-acetyltransferase [Micromonospora endophytica]BCJ62119.1 N-acetyltransferase [Micromonospora endophytica]
MSYTVRSATKTDAEPLIAVLAAAFHDGPLAEWLVPHPDERRTIHHRYFADAFANGIEHGEVYTAGAQSAVAIWYARPATPIVGRDERRTVLEAIAGGHAPNFALLEEVLGAGQPERPHHCLAYLAVDPRRQRQGLGSALLAAHHRRLGQWHLPAHLAATGLHSRRFFVRHGYTTGPGTSLPDSGPIIWPMWRGTSAGHRRSPAPPTRPRRRSL